MSVDLVTGAFGYTGSRIAARLLERGRVVRTLTRRPPGDHPLAGRLDAVPLCFDGPEALRRAFEGVETLYLTYWRRFPTRHGGFESILAEATLLPEAARDAGARVVLTAKTSTIAASDSPAARAAPAASVGGSSGFAANAASRPKAAASRSSTTMSVHVSRRSGVIGRPPRIVARVPFEGHVRLPGGTS